MERTYAILGGDRRQLRLAELLRRDGHPVFLWGVGRADEAALGEAASSDVVILPLPVSQDGATLYLPLADTRLALEELWPLLDCRRQLICGGNLSRELLEQAAGRGLKITDYFAREEVQIGNAVPTAEGAVQTAMEAMDRTIHGGKALVIGYGRIGKALAQDLKGLGAEVTVSARKYSDLAWIAARGYRALESGRLAGHLGSFDVVFNTVPAELLRRTELSELKRGCVVIDVASDPGGVDHAAADALGIQVIWARGLPGRVAPATAAQVIRDAIYHILEERGEPI